MKSTWAAVPAESWHDVQTTIQVRMLGRSGGDFKVARGGSHSTVAFYLRSANRMGTLPESRSWYTGFRVVLEVE